MRMKEERKQRRTLFIAIPCMSSPPHLTPSPHPLLLFPLSPQFTSSALSPSKPSHHHATSTRTTQRHPASLSINTHHPVFLCHTVSSCVILRHPASPCVTLRHPASPCVTLRHPASPCVPLRSPALPCATLRLPALPCVSLRTSNTRRAPTTHPHIPLIQLIYQTSNTYST